MNEPTFSVIIPTYGRPQFVAEAVESVLAQTLPDFECLVVDDAGPDVVEVNTDPRVRVIRRTHNGGPAAARNTGLDEARGKFLTFLDDDDIYTPRRLEIALEGMARAPVAICHAQYAAAPTGRNRHLEGNIWDVILDDTTPHCGATSVAREQIVRFDESFDACEDLDWWLRLSRDSTVTTVPEVGLLIRRHGGDRNRHGIAARLAWSARLLEVHADYFAQHRTARAFRWRRIGHLALLAGDRRRARNAFARSLLVEPQPRALAGWLRSSIP